MIDQKVSPAEEASISCLQKVKECMDKSIHFLVEAGAGAGKTYSLIKALQYAIEKNGHQYLRMNQKIACITYTNVAKDEILQRVDNHPVIYSETIHAFAWYNIQSFQKEMRSKLKDLSEKWEGRIVEVGETSNRVIRYNLGYPKVYENEIYLGHDDVIKLFTYFLDYDKFQNLLRNRFPVIFIDEYQDTNKGLAEGLVRNFIEKGKRPLIGFFGDHWQKIYGRDSIGSIRTEDKFLVRIGKEANFRSDKIIVEALNRIRPELIQHEAEPESKGEILIFHTNAWKGERQRVNHWKEDLPEDAGHLYFEKVKGILAERGWDLSPHVTKILLLTHSKIAQEQGYPTIIKSFRSTDDFIRKNDDYIAFLADVLEPGVNSFIERRYGKMFQDFSLRTVKIKSQKDKASWSQDMGELVETRNKGSVGNVIDLIKQNKRPGVPDRILEKEELYFEISKKPIEERTDEEKKHFEWIGQIRAIPYKEIIQLVDFLNDKTLYSTKHGTKGAEFENVLILFGGGWNQYNWNQFLEWSATKVPADKQETYERYRNLFYVSCSRAKHKLSMLFTIKLSEVAIKQLQEWFGVDVLPIEVEANEHYLL